MQNYSNIENSGKSNSFEYKGEKNGMNVPYFWISVSQKKLENRRKKIRWRLYMTTIKIDEKIWIFVFLSMSAQSSGTNISE